MDHLFKLSYRWLHPKSCKCGFGYVLARTWNKTGQMCINTFLMEEYSYSNKEPDGNII